MQTSSLAAIDPSIPPTRLYPYRLAWTCTPERVKLPHQANPVILDFAERPNRLGFNPGDEFVLQNFGMPHLLLKLARGHTCE